MGTLKDKNYRSHLGLTDADREQTQGREDEVERIRAVNAKLVAFAKDALSEFWMHDTADIQEFGIKHGLLVEAFYDPEKHDDIDSAELGDSIYVYADWFKDSITKAKE